MNPSVVLKSLFKPYAALAAAGGALMLASCYTPAPPPPGPPFGPPRYGHGGTQSPNYPTDNRPVTGPPGTGPRIVRDPNDTVVDVTPPTPRNAAPPVTDNPPPANTTPSNPSPPAEPTKPPPTAVKDDLPYGIPVVGKRGMVYSPHAPEKGQVDVEGYKRGTRVECPYTGKHFRVP
jgi:hypothetical protein